MSEVGKLAEEDDAKYMNCFDKIHLHFDVSEAIRKNAALEIVIDVHPKWDGECSRPVTINSVQNCKLVSPRLLQRLFTHFEYDFHKLSEFIPQHKAGGFLRDIDHKEIEHLDSCFHLVSLHYDDFEEAKNIGEWKIIECLRIDEALAKYPEKKFLGAH